MRRYAEGVSTTLTGSATASRPNRWLILIGAGKLAKAVLLVLLGIGALKLLHRDLVDVATRWVYALRFDPEGRFVNLLLDKLALVTPHRLRQISIVIFCYAGMDVIEGTGLVLEKGWAEYLTLILTASFLPWEAFEIVRHITWPKVVLTGLNALVVMYLVYYLQGRARSRRLAGARP
jgi:uncharacterized membrane protein (DUF2068 family)